MALLLLLLLLRRLPAILLFGNAFSFSSKLLSMSATSSAAARMRYKRNKSSSLHLMSAAAVRQDDTYKINNKLHYLRRNDEDYINNGPGIIIDNDKRTYRNIRRERLRHQRIQQVHREEQFQHQLLLEWMELERAHHYDNQGEQLPHSSAAASPPPPQPVLVNTPIPIINFRTNSDFPASSLPPSHWITHALPPLPFEDAKYTNCVSVREGRQGEEAVGNSRKRVRILVPCMNENECLVDEEDGNYKIDQKSTITSSSSSAMESSSSSSACVYIHGVTYSIRRMNEGEEIVVPQQRNEALTSPTTLMGRGGGGCNDDNTDKSQRAYLLQTKLHNAIYGQVRHGTVLQRLEEPIVIKNSTTTANSSHGRDEVEDEVVEWMATSTSVAIKQMSWDTILYQRGKLAEDPITEVAAMQYLQEFIGNELHYRQQHTESESSVKLHQHHIMMPVDLLSDDEYLYSITPFCTGGRLLDVLENKSRFSEPEARYWMRQILKGLSCLKKAGVAHRDMSPENLMVHEGNVYIIDMGMSLRIPSLQTTNNMNYGMMQQYHHCYHTHPHQRSLILPQYPCGKWYYLSPEVCLSEQPFDGPTVDLWAAGVILFIMLTGLPPWEEPTMSDDNFRLMSSGHLVRLLTERRVGLSVDAMDLLQRMFWYDPADRLSLEQVCAHPWITHEKYNIPS